MRRARDGRECGPGAADAGCRRRVRPQRGDGGGAATAARPPRRPHLWWKCIPPPRPPPPTRAHDERHAAADRAARVARRLRRRRRRRGRRGGRSVEDLELGDRTPRAGARAQPLVPRGRYTGVGALPCTPEDRRRLGGGVLAENRCHLPRRTAHFDASAARSLLRHAAPLGDRAAASTRTAASTTGLDVRAIGNLAHVCARSSTSPSSPHDAAAAGGGAANSSCRTRASSSATAARRASAWRMRIRAGLRADPHSSAAGFEVIATPKLKHSTAQTLVRADHSAAVAAAAAPSGPSCGTLRSRCVPLGRAVPRRCSGGRCWHAAAALSVSQRRAAASRRRPSRALRRWRRRRVPRVAMKLRLRRASAASCRCECNERSVVRRHVQKRARTSPVGARRLDERVGPLRQGAQPTR